MGMTWTWGHAHSFCWGICWGMKHHPNGMLPIPMILLPLGIRALFSLFMIAKRKQESLNY